MQPGRATRASASRSAARFVLCSPRPSIPGAQRETTATSAARRSITGYSSSRALGLLLGVVERRERAHVAHAERLEVEQHGRRDQRPGEATAARLVRTGDIAHAEGAVVLHEPATRAALAPRSRGARRRATPG